MAQNLALPSNLGSPMHLNYEVIRLGNILESLTNTLNPKYGSLVEGSWAPAEQDATEAAWIKTSCARLSGGLRHPNPKLAPVGLWV